tara:strand:+ start:320 stop:556 length:237 start_codon:yes stop_codon:yes gene_type:complete
MAQQDEAHFEVIDANKARALELKKLKDKTKDLENEIDRLAEENTNILTINKTLKDEVEALKKQKRILQKSIRNASGTR